MSYLDVPRLHFSGEFFADPSTHNNFRALYDITTPMPAVVPPSWNPNGRHTFLLRNCFVRGVVPATGALASAAAADRLIGGAVTSVGGRLVDLDPDFQTGSQIWAMQITVRDTASEGFTATLETTGLRELWEARQPRDLPPPSPQVRGFAVVFSGTYQSVLTNITWTPPTAQMQSALLQALRAASPTRLSIRMVTWAYNALASSPVFNVGQLVGTIGPAAASEPTQFIPDRRVVHAGTVGTFSVGVNNAAFHTGPFKVDTTRRRLVIDLGNALPETRTGARQPIGALRAEIVNAGTTPATVLGSAAIPNDATSFRVNAGVEEIPLSQAQTTALATRPIRIKAGSDLVLAERTAGFNVTAAESIVRLNPGETKDVDLFVTQLGRPQAANVHIGPSLAAGRPPGLTGLSIRTGPPAFATTLTTLPAVVRSGSNGRITLRLVAGNPGNPRGFVDGQVSFVGFHVGASPTRANQHGEIAVLVFDPHPMPTPPTWAADIRPIFTQYARLYPSMTAVIDLSNEAAVRSTAGALAAALRRSKNATNYMPFTRDLSRDKEKMILDWLDDVAATPGTP